MPDISSEKYTIKYTPENASITCEGSLLLNGALAYQPILDLLKQAAQEQAQGTLQIDICQLKFMNSSAINMMTKFIMYVSDVEPLPLSLCISAHQQIAWQERLCINLQRLMPSLKISLI
jgi:hypothetical protein